MYLRKNIGENIYQINVLCCGSGIQEFFNIMLSRSLSKVEINPTTQVIPCQGLREKIIIKERNRGLLQHRVR